MSTVAETLKAARKKIEQPENWTRGSYHRDAEGQKCIPQRAVAHCAIGALWAAGAASGDDAFHILYMANPGVMITSLNDDPKSTHADILDLYDRAIAFAEAEAA